MTAEPSSSSWQRLWATDSLFGLWYAVTHQIWWLYGVVCVIAALFMVKIFTLQHDCGHGSLFSSPLGNVWSGRLLALLTTMPFGAWKFEHDIHHGHVVDIDQIKHGDIPLLTVTQYQALPPWKQIGYRMFRHPLFLLFVTPFLYFFIKSKYPAVRTSESIWSVLITNLVVLLVYGLLFWIVGFWVAVLVFVPAAYLGGIIGIALFYIQHDYPGVEWFQTHEWDHEEASLKGSSLLRLPQPLEWFTHSIGYHHIHHLNSRIPGYKLRQCYQQTPQMQTVRPLTVADIVAAFTMKLWSVQEKRLVAFAELKDTQA